MKAADIPERPILEFLEGLNGTWATWFNYGDEPPANSVVRAVPAGTPPKVMLAKLRAMIRKGLVEGCCCGCRGDFVITELGRTALREHT